jgi:uncharacterized membrane protein
MYSGYPKSCTTSEEKVDYCRLINRGMGWTGLDQLQPEQIEDNVALRNFYKLLMNALLGNQINVMCYTSVHKVLFYFLRKIWSRHYDKKGNGDSQYPEGPERALLERRVQGVRLGGHESLRR